MISRSGQPSLFGNGDKADDSREPILMSLNPLYYDLLWTGGKTHEFRRRFLTGQSARWYVYLTWPVARLGAVIDLGPAIIDTPERIAEIAERARPGKGASVLEYVQDLNQAFAIPIQRVAEYPGMSLEQLRAQLEAFILPRGTPSCATTLSCSASARRSRSAQRAAR
ncbi:hypothetical protein [Micromonospora sp. NPDC005172]|uniref:hypothetical protein n=1 Tax=Micromonospora sp. NPDC005172 TaxID=3156867 RepID=UPI0033A2BE56